MPGRMFNMPVRRNRHLHHAIVRKFLREPVLESQFDVFGKQPRQVVAFQAWRDIGNCFIVDADRKSRRNASSVSRPPVYARAVDVVDKAVQLFFGSDLGTNWRTKAWRSDLDKKVITVEPG